VSKPDADASTAPLWLQTLKRRIGLGLEESLSEAQRDAQSLAKPWESVVSIPEWSVLRYCDPLESGSPTDQAPGRLLQESKRRREEREIERKVAAAVKREKDAKRAKGEKVDEDDEDDMDDDDDDDDNESRFDDGAAGGGGGKLDGDDSASVRTPGGSLKTRSNGRKGMAGTPTRAIGAKGGRPGKHILRRRAWAAKLRESGIDADILSHDAVDPPADAIGGDGFDAVARAANAHGSKSTGWELLPMGTVRWRLAVHMLALRHSIPECQAMLDAAPAENVWVVKPASKSRGRGIRCLRNLPAILQGRAGASQKNSNYIVQKYIERPLLIEGYKFDIRQWVLVTSFNPLTVWFFENCYLRFCCHKFTLDNLVDRFVHLANNSVQKYADDFADHAEDIAEGNMWHSRVFAGWLKERYGRDVWNDELQPKIRRCVVLALLASRDMAEERP